MSTDEPLSKAYGYAILSIYVEAGLGATPPEVVYSNFAPPSRVLELGPSIPVRDPHHRTQQPAERLAARVDSRIEKQTGTVEKTRNALGFNMF